MPRTSSTLAALDKQIEAATVELEALESRCGIQESLIKKLEEVRADVAAAIRKRKAKTPPPTGATP